MAARNKGRGLVYLRRSTGKQESSLKTQLEWALAEASKRNVALDACPADEEHMRTNRLSSYKDIRLDDGITGADMNRPGFLALIRDVLANRAISHIFIHQRDRFARPEEAIEMVAIEKKLVQAGITLVFSNGVAEPCERGNSDLVGDLTRMFAYYESGEFLRKHAERVIVAQRHIAQQGFRVGGNAPYGFVRVLVGPDGKVIEELSPKKRVRQEGCHVRIIPKDVEKIRVWRYVLDLKHKGWGFKGIAQHLNTLRVPSPGAGTFRTDQGVRHAVSGKWCAGTIAELCRNAAIIGVQDYGRRSEGAHRRLGPEGPRLLADSDRINGERPKVVFNDASVIVSRENGNQSAYDRAKWEEIQRQLEARGKNQRGVPHVKDHARYPLACRLVDLTNNCGSIMYARSRGKTPVYECGRYMRTEGAECNSNTVDGDAMVRFTLKTIRQLVDRHGSREKLLQMFRERAGRDPGEEAVAAQSLVPSLEAKASELRGDIATVQSRMAREKDDDRYRGLAEEFDRLKAELRQAERNLEEQRPQTPTVEAFDPEVEVAAAMSVLDDITRIASDPKARADINPWLTKLGIRIGLYFTDYTWGQKRVIRKLASGIMAFGNAPLPVKLHGKDNAEGRLVSPTEAQAQTLTACAAESCISITKVGRGDWILTIPNKPFWWLRATLPLKRVRTA